MNYFQDLQTIVHFALAEDIGSGDLTADLIDAETTAHAKIIAKQAAVVCGRPWFDASIQAVDNTIAIDWLVEEGQHVVEGTVICELRGSAQKLLTAERTALNFLQTLSATATQTALFVEQLQNSATKLLDTRKTLPGLRLAQKYAVKCGGGTNHRIGLYDAILIKENHIMAAGSINEAVKRAKLSAPDVIVEVETENLDELQQAIHSKADIIMLDNFTNEMLIEAVKLNQSRAKLEVSGNVEIDSLKELANIGVDYISTGAITKHIQAIDLSMRFELTP